MKTRESELVASRNEKTGQSYKHQLLFVGDVWQNQLGVRGIVTFTINPDGTKKYYFCKTNGAEHGLPEDRAGFNDGTYVGNVCDDIVLMQEFIDNGLIIDDEKVKIPTPPVVEVVAEVEPEPVAEEKPKLTRKRTTKKAEVAEVEPENEPVETVSNNKPVSLLAKINSIRAAWSKANIEKGGLGRAGGGSRYEYYKPQQVIDFCLKEEIKHNIFSEFDTHVVGDNLLYCRYQITDIDTSETRFVTCPFDIPRKIACSEAQQVGAALTYYNRRLAMLMYKIEDNSKESIDVLEDADYTAQNAPEIPTPPIVPPAPIVRQAETVTPPLPPVNVQAEVPNEPVSVPPIQEVTTIPPVQKNAKSDSVPAKIGQKPPVVELPKTETPILPVPPVNEQVVPPPPVVPAQEQPKVEEPKASKSIEDLY